METGDERVVVLECERERMLQLWKYGVCEMGGCEGKFIEEKRLAWREEKPWIVKES